MSSTETIYVENIRCGGCVKSIKESLGKLPGVQEVEVYKEEERLLVTGSGLDRNSLLHQLASLGYPEKGNNSLLRKARSLVSCATGKWS
jgi:copper chaperone